MALCAASSSCQVNSFSGSFFSSLENIGKVWKYSEMLKYFISPISADETHFQIIKSTLPCNFWQLLASFLFLCHAQIPLWILEADCQYSLTFYGSLWTSNSCIFWFLDAILHFEGVFVRSLGGCDVVNGCFVVEQFSVGGIPWKTLGPMSDPRVSQRHPGVARTVEG